MCIKYQQYIRVCVSIHIYIKKNKINLYTLPKVKQAKMLHQPGFSALDTAYPGPISRTLEVCSERGFS